MNVSKYNSKKLITFCEIRECKNLVDHAHHILEQQHADKNGFINHVRKNHKYNLVGLCESCHNKVHRGEITIQGYIQTSKGLELVYEIHNKS